MADRTVTTRLKLAVTDWTAGARTVKGDLKELNRRFTESAGFAQGFRKKLEDATKKLPKIDINVDSSAAEVKVADIRQRLESLSGKKVGVDIDAADAYAELQALQSELQALDGADVAFEVRAGVAQALAELQAVNDEIDRVDGRTANARVDAEVGGALAKIALVNAALAALPAAGSLVVGVGALAGAFTAAGLGAAAFGAVAIPTLGRINEALKQQEQAEEKARKAAGDLAPKWTDLSKAEKELGRGIKAFKDDYVEWQQALRPEVFPVINKGMDLMRLGLKEATPLAKSASSAFLTLGRDAETALTGQFWQKFFFDVNTAIPGALTGLGRSFGNVTVGLAGVIQAFLPFEPTVVGGLEKATAAFAQWGKNLETSNDFKEFISWVKTNAPAAWEEIKQIAGALVHVGEAVVPLGVGAFSGIGLLAKIVNGMSPGQIQAIALAILAIKAAQTGLKVVGFFGDLVSKVGDARTKISNFGDTVEKAKGKASGLKNAVSGLADSVGGLSGLVGGAAITGGLLILDQRFAAAAKSAEQYTEKVQAGAGSNLDAEIAALNAELAKQTELQGPNILSWIYLTDAGKTAGDRMDALTDRISDLTHQKELAAVKAKVAGDAISTMGGQAATTAGQVGGLDQSLGSFAARTDAVQAVRNMETAFKDARTAMDGSSAGLDINKAKTDAQRDAVIQAREKFSAYISSVTTAADGAKTLSGRTTDATRTILEQLPHLGSLAGKNSEAKEQVLLLAKAYGISEADARKAMSSAEGLKKVLAELKSKEIRIGLTMDVSAAEKEFGSFIARYSNKSLAIALATKTRAAGGIQTSRGVDLMAAGGLKGSSSTSPPPPPAIRSQATYVPGSATVYAEAGREAYIPYDTSYRARAIQILGQVATDFGLEVYSKQAEQKTTTLVSGLQTTNTSITSSLADATRELDTTLGSSGALTKVVSQVGTVGASMTAGWVTGSYAIGDSVTGMSGAVTSGSEKIAKATSLVKDAALAVAEAISKAGTGKGSQGSVVPPAPGGSGRGSQGATNVPAPKGSGKGSLGSVIPPAPPAPKAITVGADRVASLPGVSASAYSTATNYSRVSAPSIVVVPMQVAATAAAGAATNAGSGSPSSAGGTVVNVDMTGAVIREEADVTKVGREIGWNVNAYG